MSTLYFAYGSNMARAELAAWCEGARALGPAELPGHRLAFLRRSIRWRAGVADIVAATGESVWGVLYELPLGLGELDAKEGAGLAYRRRELEVMHAGTAVTAVAYELIRKEPAEVPPRADYVELLVQGAVEHGLPGHYVDRLRSVLPAPE